MIIINEDNHDDAVKLMSELFIIYTFPISYFAQSCGIFRNDAVFLIPVLIS